jgi:uncharacterized protein (UPF0332 family)
MAYERLVKNGLIKPYAATKIEIAYLLQIARRDITAARRNLKDDPDWAYSMAYNALLQASRALILHEGYRPRGGEQHVTVVEFIKERLGQSYSSQVNMFDQMRRKRHRLIYETPGIVSTTEVNSMINFSEKFIEEIDEVINRQPTLGI